MRGQVLYTPNLTFDSSLHTDEQDNSPTPIYGVSWTNDESTTMTRTDDAVGLSFSIDSTTGKAISSFDNVFPYNRMKRKVINGNTYVYIPECWFRATLDNDYNLIGIAVSEHKGQGVGWFSTESFYVGAYLNSLNNLILSSVANATPINSKTEEELQTLAEYTGPDYRIITARVNILRFLQWIELGTKNIASLFSSLKTAPAITGIMDNIYNETLGGNFCVTAESSSHNGCVWRGIENAFTNIDYSLTYLFPLLGESSDDGIYYRGLGDFMLPSTGNCITQYSVNPKYWLHLFPTGLAENNNLNSGFCTYCINATDFNQDIPSMFDDSETPYAKTYSRLEI